LLTSNGLVVTKATKAVDSPANAVKK